MKEHPELAEGKGKHANQPSVFMEPQAYPSGSGVLILPSAPTKITYAMFQSLIVGYELRNIGQTRPSW